MHEIHTGFLPSKTTVDARNPAPPGMYNWCNNGINYVSIGAGFLPSKTMKPQKLPEQSAHSSQKALNRHLDRMISF